MFAIEDEIYRSTISYRLNIPPYLKLFDIIKISIANSKKSAIIRYFGHSVSLFNPPNKYLMLVYFLV